MVPHQLREATVPRLPQADMAPRQRPEATVRPLGVAMDLLRRPEDMEHRLQVDTVSRATAY